MKKLKKGIVVSTKMNKTAIVQVDRMVPHPKYGKRYRVSKRYAAHDEENRTHVGETVFIQETRPISKIKHWKILSSDQREGEK